MIKAMPVLTLLAASERADHQRGRRHKLLTDWARQGILQLCRWLGEDANFEYTMTCGSIVKVHRHGQGSKGGLKARPSAALVAV